MERLGRLLRSSRSRSVDGDEDSLVGSPLPDTDEDSRPPSREKSLTINPTLNGFDSIVEKKDTKAVVKDRSETAHSNKYKMLL